MRIHFLDSTRGLAALMVIIFHVNGLYFFDITHWGQTNAFNILTTIFNGSDAVSYFFVLSGFVLSFKYFQSNFDEPLLKYTARRLFRILPLYLIVVILSYLFLASGNSKMDFIKELNLFSGSNKLVKPGWSLSVEICLSLLVPFMVILIKNDLKRSVFLLVVLILSYRWITCFTTHFLLGSMLAYLVSMPTSINFFSGILQSSGRRIAIFLLLLLPYSMRFWINLVPPLKTAVDTGCELINLQKDYFYFFLSAFASFMVIYLVLKEPLLQKILSLSPLTYLGKISFSLYLVHYPLLKFFETINPIGTELINGSHVQTLLAYQFIIIAASALVASLTYYAIEKPFMDLGKKVIYRLNF